MKVQPRNSQDSQTPHHYDRTLPWNLGVDGDEVLPLINDEVGVLCVQAGAGTGKTFGLRRRVLRLMHREGLAVPHHKILVCAFNRVIARDLEREIQAQLAPFNLPLPAIRTVHALCAGLLTARGRRLMLHEIDEMIFDVLAEHASVAQKYRQPQAVRAVREHEAGFQDHPALMQAVRNWLTEHHAGLIGDLPREVDRAIAAGDLNDRYDHILVDEFQDLTRTEVRILLALRAATSSFVAVGDRKQSIYAFRGNEERGLDALPRLIARPIAAGTMSQSRRCPSEIITLANAVMSLEDEPLEPIFTGGQLHSVLWKTPQNEAKGMARRVARVFRAAPKKKHLVLVTRTEWGYALRDALKKFDAALPVQTVFAEDVLRTWSAREAFIFFSIIGDSEDPVTLRDWLAYESNVKLDKPFSATDRNADAYLKLKKAEGVLTLERALALAEKPESEFHGNGRSNIAGRLTRLEQLHATLPLDGTPSAVIDWMFVPERWVGATESHPARAREDLERLRREAHRILDERPGSTLRDLVRDLRYRIAIREPIGAEEQAEESGRIRIVTLWGAKGLTADYVYLTGLCDEALPGEYDPVSSGLPEAAWLDEQRRLLFVSLTRARIALVLSRAAKTTHGEVQSLRLLWHRGGDKFHQSLGQTRFFNDVPLELLPKTVDGETWPGVAIGLSGPHPIRQVAPDSVSVVVSDMRSPIEL